MILCVSAAVSALAAVASFAAAVLTYTRPRKRLAQLRQTKEADLPRIQERDYRRWRAETSAAVTLEPPTGRYGHRLERARRQRARRDEAGYAIAASRVQEPPEGWDAAIAKQEQQVSDSRVPAILTVLAAILGLASAALTFVA